MRVYVYFKILRIMAETVMKRRRNQTTPDRANANDEPDRQRARRDDPPAPPVPAPQPPPPPPRDDANSDSTSESSDGRPPPIEDPRRVRRNVNQDVPTKHVIIDCGSWLTTFDKSSYRVVLVRNGYNGILTTFYNNIQNLLLQQNATDIPGNITLQVFMDAFYYYLRARVDVAFATFANMRAQNRIPAVIGAIAPKPLAILLNNVGGFDCQSLGAVIVPSPIVIPDGVNRPDQAIQQEALERFKSFTVMLERLLKIPTEPISRSPIGSAYWAASARNLAMGLADQNTHAVLVIAEFTDLTPLDVYLSAICTNQMTGHVLTPAVPATSRPFLTISEPMMQLSMLRQQFLF